MPLPTFELTMIQTVAIIVSICVGLVSILTSAILVTKAFTKAGAHVARLSEALDNLASVVDKGFERMNLSIRTLELRMMRVETTLNIGTPIE